MITDIDGSPLLVLSKREAKALCEYFEDENFYRQFRTLSGIWDKAEKCVAAVPSYSRQ